MGAYLSEPKTTKESTDSDGVNVRCGASSMQGWRISQEDAHNCILDFDENSSLFAVYDGHGGHEVAEYCSKILPDFIKQTDSYKKGDYEQALKDAFLGFDATLATPEVVSILKTIASGKEEEKHNSDPDADSGSEEDEAIDNLVQEAHMPLDEVMAKYKGAGPLCRVLKAEGKPLSPMLRGCRTNTNGAGTSSSGDADVSSSSNSYVAGAELCNGETHMNGEVGGEEGKSKIEAEVKVESSDGVKKKTIKSESGESDSVKKCEENIGRTEPDSSGLSNGDSQDVSSSSESGGAGPANEGNDGISSSSPSKKKRISSRDIYQTLLQDDSDSEEEDETFTADAESDDGSSDDVTEGKEAEDDEEESTVEDEEDEDEEDSEYPGMDVNEEPGSDSGCTAVVALLTKLEKEYELFVANAGDSRCVVCYEGKTIEMSVDHKPEDEQEKERIETAGGKVTCDGRVNGGLNLSRAIGDHAYKQLKLLPPEKQMITALPDVQRFKLDPDKFEFMVLACDGIWNSMTSQDVVEFVRAKLKNTEKLSQICEELFDFCLAPNTQGDGTGCDNMTCVIMQFNPQGTTNKRSADEHINEPSAKKTKVEETQAT